SASTRRRRWAWPTPNGARAVPRRRGGSSRNSSAHTRARQRPRPAVSSRASRRALTSREVAFGPRRDSLPAPRLHGAGKPARPGAQGGRALRRGRAFGGACVGRPPGRAARWREGSRHGRLRPGRRRARRLRPALDRGPGGEGRPLVPGQRAAALSLRRAGVLGARAAGPAAGRCGRGAGGAAARPRGGRPRCARAPGARAGRLGRGGGAADRIAPRRALEAVVRGAIGRLALGLVDLDEEEVREAGARAARGWFVRVETDSAIVGEADPDGRQRRLRLLRTEDGWRFETGLP